MDAVDSTLTKEPNKSLYKEGKEKKKRHRVIIARILTQPGVSSVYVRSVAWNFIQCTDPESSQGC